MFKTKSKFNLLRIPQVFAILYIVVLILISLDFSKDNMSLFLYITDFIIRMIPIMFLILILNLFTKHPYIGGLLFIIASIGITLSLQSFNTLSTFLAVSLPILIIGVLLIIFTFLENLN